MRKPVLLLLAASVCASPAWTAETEDKSARKLEGIGLGSGAAAGAIAGGPVGLIVGAALGGWLGDRFGAERDGRRAAERDLERAEGDNAVLARALGTKERELTRTEAALAAERNARRADLEAALDIDVFFRTEQSTLPDGAEQRLAKLAELVRPMEGAVIVLEGHADVRGTESFNEALSAARASAVRDALIRAGMPAERIVTSGEGERYAAGAEQDADGMALDRRVALRVVDRDAAVAQQ